MRTLENYEKTFILAVHYQMLHGYLSRMKNLFEITNDADSYKSLIEDMYECIDTHPKIDTYGELISYLKGDADV